MARDALEETRELLRTKRIRMPVRKVGDCLVWLGARNRGYGRMWWLGRIEYVHRVVYRHFSGDTIPEGWDVDHMCDRAACVNPEHLQTLPRHMNTNRMAAQRGRRMCPHPSPRRARWGSGNCLDCRSGYMKLWRRRRKDTQ